MISVRPVTRVTRFVLGGGVAVAMLFGADRLRAQGSPFAGQWTMAFNHELYSPTNSATDHLEPFLESTPYVNCLMTIQERDP